MKKKTKPLSTKISLSKALLSFYCFTGYDTISAFAGQGKPKPLNLLFHNEEYIDVLCSLGEVQTLTNDMVKKVR